MTDNFELLEIGQIIQMHQQVHDRLGAGEEDCDMLRMQHDSLAAEMVKRGENHDTEIVCPEIGTNAPNYRRGFTDDVCTQCAFGQLFPWCNLYKFNYTKGYTCDSFQYFEVLELEPPHGFLMMNGKQTAIAHNKSIPIDKPYLIVSGDEVFGIATLSEPIQMKEKEFDKNEWAIQHRITPRERRQWWPGASVFYMYPLEDWQPYEKSKLYENGRVVNEPKLTYEQRQIISAAKELPKQITLVEDVVSVTDNNEFIIFPEAECQQLKAILAATYETEIKNAGSGTEDVIPVYSLALVRNPRMRVSKKSASPEGQKKEAIEATDKQEDETMPFRIRARGDEFCVVKVEADDSDGESQGCHETREEAEAQLTALNINVTAEEENAYTGDDKPRKKKPKPQKKELEAETEKKAGFMEGLRSLSKSIGDFLKSAETEENKGLLFVDNVGIAQKRVNGELWHFTWSTNAFEDREGEIFSTKSLERYVEQAEEKADRGFFNLWHINKEDGNFNTDFARKEWQGVVGRFLVEAGPYLEDEKGAAAKEFFSKFSEGHPELAPEGWGCSPEFRYLPEERKAGIYENIWITRTSTLPKMAAANIWTDTRQLTRSKNMALSEQQTKAAVELFGKEYVDNLLAEGDKRTEELEVANVAHKGEAEQPVPEQKPQEIQLNMEDLAAEIGKQFQADVAPIAEALVAVAERVEKLEETKKLKAVSESPRYVFNIKRASDNDETVVTDDDALKKSKPAETKASDGDSWGQLFNK